VITAEKLQVNYGIGPGVWLPPFMERTMPDSLRERISSVARDC